jgi:hypothetical protein
MPPFPLHPAQNLVWTLLLSSIHSWCEKHDPNTLDTLHSDKGLTLLRRYLWRELASDQFYLIVLVSVLLLGLYAWGNQLKSRTHSFWGSSP